MASSVLRALLTRFFSLLCLFFFTSAAHAAVRCANNNDGALLRQLLLQAAASGNALEDIRIAQGTYSLAPGNFLGTTYQGREYRLSGGWDATCSAQVIDPANTVLDFQGSTTYLQLNGDRKFTVEGLTFSHFNQIDFEESCSQGCPVVDQYVIRLNRFHEGNVVLFEVQKSSSVTIQNNLFFDLTGDVFMPPVLVKTYNSGSPRVEFGFNTIANVSCTNKAPNDEVFLFDVKGTSALIHHNIFSSPAQTCGASVSIATSQAQQFSNNLYASKTGFGAVHNSGNVISLNPGFVNAAQDDYHLAAASPAVNKGMNDFALNNYQLSAPPQDLDGPVGGRRIGQYFDIGAFESATDYSTILTVTTTADNAAGTASVAGSLRAAIESANLTTTPKIIRFNLPYPPGEDCDSYMPTINLLRPLPPVTGQLEIDGYSQPGSYKNTSTSLNSNLQLCVLIHPDATVLGSTGTMSSALSVPASATDAQLTVSGLVFGSSNPLINAFDAAIRLSGGSNHSIYGNSFGGKAPAPALQDIFLGANYSHVRVEAPAKDVEIGGSRSNPETKNIFEDSAGPAIGLYGSGSTGNHIENNFIGLTADGSTPRQIGSLGEHAINVVDSGLGLIWSNTIVGADGGAAIKIDGASASDYDIQLNRIGIGTLGQHTSAFSNLYGVRVTGQAARIFLAGNLITNNQQAGVWLDPTAGNYSQITQNSIYENGLSYASGLPGAGLGIDLNTLGVEPNDDSDGDGGPNTRQNWPVITSSSQSASDATKWTVTGSLNSLPNHAFTIEVFRSLACTGEYHSGDAQFYLGSIDVTTNGRGNAVFSLDVDKQFAPAYLTATATNASATLESTSEVGECWNEDRIFQDDFE